MNPMTIIVPLALLVGGVLTFFLVPLEFGVRVILLVGDIVAALVVGLILWRRNQG